jgi:signal transduction histidine kinase
MILWRSLRVRIALLGFIAMYVPVLLLLGVVIATEDENSVVVDGVEVVETVPSERSAWTIWTVVALAPVAAATAWWLGGRAVRPIERVRAVSEEIEATDLSRRIDLRTGPTEVISLAASFDAMLERIEHSADAQRQLIDQTSHDLRTPLSVMTANADVLLRHPDPTLELYRDGLVRSRAAAARMQATIDELLVHARGRARAVDHRPVDVPALVRAAVDDARTLSAPRHIRVELEAPDAAPCSIDPVSFRRALTNILDNAVRHSPDSSTVEVEVACERDRISVAVTDHGTGIPSEDREAIFERHWRGGDSPNGTGLGLAIARQVALAHGGSLTVDSPGPGGDGSVFTITVRRSTVEENQT